MNPSDESWKTIGEVSVNSSQKGRERSPTEWIASLGLNSLGLGRAKIDLSTPLEKFLLGGFLISGVLALTQMLGNDPSTVIGFFFISLAFGGAWWSTDNYYVLDMQEKCIFYHFQCVSIEKELLVSRFSSLVGETRMV